MKCPNCKDCELEPKPTTTGVEIDTCRRCNSVWLDRGKIFLQIPSKQISPFNKAIEEAVQKKEKSGYKSQNNRDMYPISNLPIDSKEIFVDDNRGIWATERGINELRTSSSFRLEWAETSAPATRYIKRLPNLVLSSTVTFGALYGLVSLALITLSLLFEADSGSGDDGLLVGGSLLVISFIITIIGFLMGPLILIYNYGGYSK